MKILICSILLFWLISVSYAKLYVYHPTSLRNRINRYTGEIKSSLANFGLVNYGHSIIGRVWYDDSNQDGCNEYNLTIDGTGDPDADPSPIVLVNRGNCPFTQKVRNVEHAGGRLAIVIDDRIDENIEDVIMVDDGSGNGIRIPSILVSKKDGEIILDEMLDSDGNHTDPKVALMATFTIEHPDNRVEWDFWYTSSSAKALDFLKGYREYHEKLGSKTLFTPHFSFWTCKDCDKKTKQSDCFGDGKYWAVDERNSGFSGQEILYENIRQKCLYDMLTKDKNENMWWEYILKAHSHCHNGINKDCSEQVHEKLGLDFKKTQNCVEDSFYGDNHTKEENDILQDEYKYWKKYGPHFFPAAVINNVTFRGSLNPPNFFAAVWEGFKDQPKECSTKNVSTTIIEGINTSTLLMIIVALVVINVGIIICYKKYAKKEMDEKIEMHINSAVSQYFAIQDKSSSRTLKPLVH